MITLSPRFCHLLFVICYSLRACPNNDPRSPNQSRRSFLRKAVAGAGATAAAVVTPRLAEAAQQGSQNAAAATSCADSRAG